jgi:DNA (cytosine-5)-methyltransferase 1
MFQVELDPNCQQTLAHHWPTVSKFGDIKEVSGYQLPFVDLITFGSPCQDLSVAGKRLGLDGERSGLFYEATRIIKEMREKSNGQYPKWSIWENVTGALSSNGGADFGEVLSEMDEAGACFSEWAVLDAQYFGVPQRRRRVYLLSVFDPGIARRCPSKILPVKEGSSGGSSQSTEQKQKTSRGINSSTSGDSKQLAVNHHTFTPGKHASYIEGVGTLRANGGDIGGGSETLIVESPRVYSGAIGNQHAEENKMTIESVVGFSHTQGLDPQASTSAWPTLRANGNGHAVSIEKAVRRLTPIECERLMGWPDNHTLYRADGKENSDTVRYRMCGNGVASPVVKWIADKIINI